MGPTEHDVVVVGAGIIGAACAAELATRGKSVLLLEAVGVASDTSCRAMGHVGVYDDNPAQLSLTRFAVRLWTELAPELPEAVEFVRRGALWVALTDEENREVELKERVYRQAGVEARAIDSATLRRMEPNLRPGLPGALYVPGDVVLDATEATRFLADRAVKMGADLRVGARVRALETSGVRLDDGSRLRAGTVVVAAGWRSPEVFPGLPIRPRKGHIVLFAPRPGYVQHQVSEIGYVRGAHPGAAETISFSFQPRTSGRYLLGATRQYVGASTDVDDRVIARLLRRAREFLPDIDSLSIERTWTGLRPAGPDSVPIIGPAPGHPEWILAVAHEGIGITTSLATGKLVSDIACGRPPSIPLDPILPNRLSELLSDSAVPVHDAEGPP